MKTLRQYSLVLSGIFLLLLAACANEKKKSDEQTAESQQELASKKAEPMVIFENDYAVVEKISLEPGAYLESHQGGKRVIYSLTDYTIDWDEEGKEPGSKSWKKGDAHFHEAGMHSAKNSGTTTAEWLVFMTKDKELPDCKDNTLEYDAHTVSPDVTRQLLDNDDFRLTEVNLPPGGMIPAHTGINRIIYALSDYKIIYESDSEGENEKQFKEGDVHWHDACPHALKNSGRAKARFLVVSYKAQK